MSAVINPPTHKMVHCRFTSDTLLLVLAMSQMAALQISMNRYHSDAVAGREQILAQEHKNEIAIAMHIKTATERWESFRLNNRNLAVPNIPEGIHP